MPESEMEAGGAKSKKALASKANRSIVASSAPPRLSAVRCALIKAQMLPDAGGKEGEGDRGNARSIWRGRPYCFALME